MTKSDTTLEQLSKQLGIIFYALLVAQVVILGAVIALREGGDVELPTLRSPLVDFGIPAFVILQASLALFLSSRRIESARTIPDRSEKLQSYRVAFILKLATLEGAFFLSLAGYLLSNDFLFLLLAAGIMFLLIMNRPILEKIETELMLGKEVQG